MLTTITPSTIIMHGTCGIRTSDPRAQEPLARSAGKDILRSRRQFPTSSPIDNVITAPRCVLLYTESGNTDEPCSHSSCHMPDKDLYDSWHAVLCRDTFPTAWSLTVHRYHGSKSRTSDSSCIRLKAYPSGCRPTSPSEAPHSAQFTPYISWGQGSSTRRPLSGEFRVSAKNHGASRGSKPREKELGAPRRHQEKLSKVLSLHCILRTSSRAPFSCGPGQLTSPKGRGVYGVSIRHIRAS
jgi:hypothetical protein